jgi:tRNA (guanine-N7-)-methyltransferase
VGSKNKLKRFRENENFQNVFQPTREEVVSNSFPLKGKWNTDFFKNNHPIILELGCGKGEYSVGLGRKYPEKNFIGVDLKGNRIYIGAKDALETDLTNVAFLRTRIDFILDYFGEQEVDEIWLTFSDPQPNKARKRLSSPLFIDRYKKILKPGGIVHMKTDSDILFEYTLEQIEENNYECLESTWDLYANLPEDLDQDTREIFYIQTYYEKLFSSRGHKIKYCKFKIS